jgi:ABC-type uncharacterized transport system fused permease/ATPase subunit
MFNRLISLGCSLTHQIGWADQVASTLEIPLINLAVSAGSNQIQQKRIQEFILRNGISNHDLVVWQITGTSRHYNRERLTFKWRHNLKKELTDSDEIKRDPSYHFTFTRSSQNLIDFEERIDFLCTSPYAIGNIDEADLLEDILFHLVTIKKYTPYLLVVLGWEQAITNQNRNKFIKLLKEYHIDCVDEYICEWCANQNLPFDGTLHPSHNSYQEYALNVLIPKIRELL